MPETAINILLAGAPNMTLSDKVSTPDRVLQQSSSSTKVSFGINFHALDSSPKDRPWPVCSVIKVACNYEWTKANISGYISAKGSKHLSNLKF